MYLITPERLEGGFVQVALSLLIACIVRPFHMNGPHPFWPLPLIAANIVTKLIWRHMSACMSTAGFAPSESMKPLHQ